MENLALKVRNLTKSFSTGFFNKLETKIVNNISFDIGHGEIVGLLGTNGAGKTTTIQMLLGVMTPSSGEINYFGLDFSKYRSQILEHVSFASTYVKMPGKLTIYENLNFHAQLYGIPKQNRIAQINYYLELFGIADLKNRPAGKLSAGQTTRLMLAKAFITNPKIVLLDEPTAALDPEISQTIRDFIKEQRSKYNISVLFTSHNMDEVAEICDRVLVLKSGNIIANNSPEELARSVSNAHVQVFLGHLLDKAELYAQEHKIPYKVFERSIEFEINENSIADLLMGLAAANISYSNISIDKPSLEDYFLYISKNK